MRHSILKAAALATVLLAASGVYAESTTLNDTTHHANQTSATKGHAHRGMSTPTPQAADPGTTQEKGTPDARNPGIGTSASGMGTTDGTMSSSTGSEGHVRPVAR